MSKSMSINLDTTPMHRLSVSAEQAASAYIKVGVLGDYADRTPGQTGTKRTNAAGGKEAINNPSLGAIHEFGSLTRGIPPRSFLRMPLISRLSDEINKESQETWEQYFVNFGFIDLLRAIGEASLAVIKDAFKTGGFGRWAKLRPYTIRRKGNDRILIDSGQLERSVTYAVVAPGAPKKPI